MGTETRPPFLAAFLWRYQAVKLNNPLMGTETSFKGNSNVTDTTILLN